MIFTQFRFLFFFTAVLGVYWSLRGNRSRKIWLLLCSFLFYASWNWRFLLLILGTTHVDYFSGLWMSREKSPAKRKALLLASLGANLGVLGYFKYFNFFVASAVEFSRLLGLPLQARLLNVVLPIGISFTTFQAMGYLIDVYRGRLKPARSLLDFALFIVFFPKLICGPILRGPEFLPELGQAKSWSNVDVRSCLVLFMIGFFKKACAADNISPFIDPFFADPAHYTAGSAWLSMLLYSAQVYCDFSGYTDIAIASAGLLGYSIPRNFHFPYFSKNMAEFWSRWDMTLTDWLRDYAFLPLLGLLRYDLGARSSSGIYASIMIILMLTGIWHGASWLFVAWGLAQGIALVIYAAGPLPRLGLRPLRPAAGALATYAFWTFCGLVLFRSTDVPNAVVTLKSLWLLHSPGNLALPAYLGCGFLLLSFAHYVSYRGWLEGCYRTLPSGLFYFLYGAAFALMMSLARVDYLPFIYFQF